MDVASEYQKMIEKIMHFKNGVVSELISTLGYESSYGLSIPVIDDIAVNFGKNNELALYCWKQPLREAKLLALRIFDANLLDKATLNKVIENISNSELAEQLVYRMLELYSDRINIAKQLVLSQNEYVQYAGLIQIRSIAKNSKESDDQLYIELLETINSIRWSDKMHIKRGLAGALLQIGEKNNFLEQKVLFWINNHNFNNQHITNWIEKEVVYFLETKTD